MPVCIFENAAFANHADPQRSHDPVMSSCASRTAFQHDTMRLNKIKTKTKSLLHFIKLTTRRW